MLTDELTVFDIKFNEGIERLDKLLTQESSTISIKNYVERYRLDKSLENRMSKKNSTSNSRNYFKENKRNQIVDIYEIRDHDKKVQQVRNKNYLKNEIEWFKIKKREDEQKKYNYNKAKYENSLSMNKSDNNKDIIRNNNLKMKKFSSIANKVNIDKFMKQKKLNQFQNQNNQNINNEQKILPHNNSNNNFQDGVFIPYSEYKKYEMIMNNNKNILNNNIYSKKNNMLNSNKSEKIKNNAKVNNTTQNNKKENNLLNYQNAYNNYINKIINKNSNSNKYNSQNKNNNKNSAKNINNNRNITHSINIRNTNFQSASVIKNKNIITQSQENKSSNKNKINNRNTAPKNIDNRYNIDIRKPLDKRIDYLRERNTSQEQRVKIYESKNLFKDKKDILNNINMLNIYSKKYEDEAKRQEQLMRVKGSNKYGNEDNVKLSNLLIDSISSKLAILNQITSQNK